MKTVFPLSAIPAATPAMFCSATPILRYLSGKRAANGSARASRAPPTAGRHAKEQSKEEQRGEGPLLPGAAELSRERPGTDKQEQRKVEDQQYQLGAGERGGPSSVR